MTSTKKRTIFPGPLSSPLKNDEGIALILTFDLQGMAIWGEFDGDEVEDP